MTTKLMTERQAFASAAIALDRIAHTLEHLADEPEPQQADREAIRAAVRQAYESQGDRIKELQLDLAAKVGRIWELQETLRRVVDEADNPLAVRRIVADVIDKTS